MLCKCLVCRAHVDAFIGSFADLEIRNSETAPCNVLQLIYLLRFFWTKCLIMSISLLNTLTVTIDEWKSHAMPTYYLIFINITVQLFCSDNYII